MFFAQLVDLIGRLARRTQRRLLCGGGQFLFIALLHLLYFTLIAFHQCLDLLIRAIFAHGFLEAHVLLLQIADELVGGVLIDDGFCLDLFGAIGVP
jgi:hypothetical protein